MHGVHEDFLRIPVFNQPAQEHKSRIVRDAGGLLHVVRHDDNGKMLLELGDQVFFYHSVNEKQIVGICEVVKLYYPDPTDASGRFGMVDVKAVKPFAEPVTLAQIKAEPRLQDLALVRQSRLSVLPVSDKHWALICAMGETKP